METHTPLMTTAVLRRRTSPVSTEPKQMMSNDKLAELSREAEGGKFVALRDLLRFLRKEKVRKQIIVRFSLGRFTQGSSSRLVESPTAECS